VDYKLFAKKSQTKICPAGISLFNCPKQYYKQHEKTILQLQIYNQQQL
jgi:hypothetical protein